MTRAPVERRGERRRKEWPRDEGEIVGVRCSYDPSQASHRTGPDRRVKVETNMQVTDEMVNRFLSWPLPPDFHPDAGISFNPEFNIEWNAKHGKPPQRHEPIGTNLLTAEQARAMLEFVLATDRRQPAEGVTIADSLQSFVDTNNVAAFDITCRLHKTQIIASLRSLEGPSAEEIKVAKTVLSEPWGFDTAPAILARALLRLSAQRAR